MSGPIICSKFDQSGNYLATGMVALDSHQVKVQSITSSQASLNTSFTLEKSNKLVNLAWIPSDSIQLLALCLSKGSILIYSTQTNEIVLELISSANVSILDFHYSTTTRTGWSCDIEGNVYEWDLNSYLLVDFFKVNEYIESVDSINRISTVMFNSQPHLLLGSNAVYLFNIKQRELVKTFPGHIQPVNSITALNNDMFLTSAKGDRFVNLYQLDKTATKAVFVGLSSVSSLSVSIKDDKSVLVIINEEGDIEIFNNPLADAKSQVSTPVPKKKRKQVGVSSRSFNASIKLSRPEPEIKSPQDTHLFINAVSTEDNLITFTWLENSTIPFFDTLKWIDETGSLLLESAKVLLKSKPNLKVTQHLTNGHDVAAPKLYTEGHTIVSDGSNIRDLEFQDHQEDEEDTEESLAEKLERLAMDQTSQQKSRRRKLEEARSGVSLSIVLTQSLKNNDQALLETVLSNRDPITIQNTISRLDPYSCVTFLDKLSEKIQRQPTRFDQVSFWLKWILVIHGPTMASLPNLSIKLSSLRAVLNKKAEELPRLLELQGRLKLMDDSAALRNEFSAEEIAEDLEERSDIEYNEEIDDAKYVGVISDDESMDDVDDFDDLDDKEEEEEEEEEYGIPDAANLDDREDSDLE